MFPNGLLAHADEEHDGEEQGADGQEHVQPRPNAATRRPRAVAPQVEADQYLDEEEGLAQVGDSLQTRGDGSALFPRLDQ